MSNRTISLLTGLTLLGGVAAGWMLQQTASAEAHVSSHGEMDSRKIGARQPPADESRLSTAENEENGSDDGGGVGPAEVDEPAAADAESDAEAPSKVEDQLSSEREPQEEAAEEEAERMEEIVVRLQSSESVQTDVKNELEVFEERLETAESRIADLEQRLSLMEEDMEEVLAWQDVLEESLTRLEELGETVVDAEAARREAQAARMARATALERIGQDLDNILLLLERGSFAVDRQIRVASQGLAQLAAEATRHGHLLESERVDAAIQSLRLSETALAHRDLYETRLAIGMAVTHVAAAHSLARMKAGP